ncbi:MAG: DUF1565 domain-containing protein, partial [Planctomycetota bacterium]|nr:DUF1565 domain-containing protein [Planctomycetota bacterium]
MKHLRHILPVPALFAALALPFAHGRDVFVSPTGDDGGDGSPASPFRTLCRAITDLTAGDTCILRAGHYHERVSLNGLRGTTESPVTIRAYPGEEAILDG